MQDALFLPHAPTHLVFSFTCLKGWPVVWQQDGPPVSMARCRRLLLDLYSAVEAAFK